MKEKTITLSELSSYLNALLDPMKMEDMAPNGVQVGHTGPITSLATAVTASLETLEEAARLGVQALIVHHGIFKKGDPYPLVGTLYKKIQVLIKHDIALLGYHLPLDAHRELGNNYRAALDLGLQNLQPFAEYYKVPIGVIGHLVPVSFDEFKRKVEKYYGRPAAFVKVKDSISSVAIVSGGAEKSIVAAAHAGADCFITGRFDEPVWDSAHEEGISFLGLGHYTTETVGPMALGEHLQKVFGIPCTFIKTENPF